MRPMLIVDLKDCPEFIAGDDTRLREVLHPDKTYTKDNNPLSIRYSLAHASLEPGKASQPHKLRTSEVYYILQGTGEMHIDDETAPVAPGQTIYIPPNAVQHIRNTGPTTLQFLCIVDPAWHAEDETIL